MADANFKSVQATHESLLQKQQNLTEENQQAFVGEVRAYIEQAKKAGSVIPATRERDQVRANLRYWANYIYGVEGVFPDTELAPSTVSEKQPVGNIIAIVLFIILVLFGAVQAFRSTFNQLPPATEPPPVTEPPATTEPIVGTSTAATIPEATFTPEFSGINVLLSSPTDGEFITPNVKFEGTYDNLRAGWAIHALFVKGGKYFPVEKNYPIPERPTGNTWEIETIITETDEEMSQAQSYSIVLAVSTNLEDRETLTDASKDGIEIKSLPDTVLLFDRTATVIYRDPFTVIRGERTLVYALSEGNSAYDLHIIVPERGYQRQITFTQDVSELSPNLSADGTKIVYVHKDEATETYSIHVMDSNGENDFEIVTGGQNLLENPQWSPNSSYISYALGNSSQSASRVSWSIHTYEIETKKDNAISDEPESLVQPYHTWLPDSSSIIFETRPQPSGTTGFDAVLINSSESPSHFFDSDEDDIQPRVKPIENGYFMTFTIVREDKKHDIYGALLYPERQFPFDGFQIRLTNTRAGEIVRGLESASTNFPIPDPDPNSTSIYYLRNNNIYRLEFNIVNGQIVLLEGKINDGERFGDEVIDPPLGQDISGYDVGYLHAFFPIP